MQYFITMTTHVPDGTPEQAVDDIRAREAARSRELAAQGHLLRLWRPPLGPDEWRTLETLARKPVQRAEHVLRRSLTPIAQRHAHATHHAGTASQHPLAAT